MLLELTIRNFAVIRETRIEFGPGLNALTGETGAGKSIVLDALGAVLGERTSPAVVRTGEERAYVEAIFDLSENALSEDFYRRLEALGIELDPSDPLVLSRDITASRSTARINGRALTAGALTEIGELLVDIHGQSDHLSLLRPQAQMEILDSFAAASAMRVKVRTAYEQWQAIRRRIFAFESERRVQAQRIDLLRLQLNEIELVEPIAGEYEELESEQRRLTYAARLLSLAEQTRIAFEGTEGVDGIESGALDQLRSAESALADMSRLDPATETYLRQLRDALYALDELSTDLRGYLDLVDIDPQRLDFVGERLQAFRELTRKYGSTIEEVLDYAARIRLELETLEGEATNIDDLRAEESRLEQALARLACELSQRRLDAGSELARRVESTIAELNMGNARFEVEVRQREDPSGIDVGSRRLAVDESGIDSIAFLLAANPGSAPQPLARVASGGETARLMLALKSILSEADATPTLIFDEIDVGIGGRSGQIVGEKLWSLTSNHQVIVISHLPQVAAFADRHTTMVKRDVDDLTETTAEPLAHDTSIDEIATMFDGKPVSPESRASAEGLLRRVNSWKMDHARVQGSSVSG